MKIFGWVHQKLCLGTAEYRRVAHRNSPDVFLVEEGSGKNGTVSATHEKERDTEALLLHGQVLLTIGTFGHSAPQPDHQEKQQQQQQQQIQEEEHEDEEADHSAVVKPTASVPHSSTLEISKLPESDEKKLIKQEVMMIDQEMVISREPLLKEDKEKSIEKRTTLADLLAADQEATSNDKSAADKKHAATCPTMNVLKKIKNTESPPASKKMHRLITRMLKKKIHPDLARGDQEQHARRGAADGAVEGRYGDFRLRRGG